MGYPYNILVAPAVLYLNPGITKEEYIQLLDETHSSCFREYTREDSWEEYRVEDEDKSFHNGISGLARILNLEYSDEFKKFQKYNEDDSGLIIHPIQMFPDERKGCLKYVVIIHERNEVGDLKVVNELSWGQLKEGDIWGDVFCGTDKGIVAKILTEDKLYDKDENDDEGSPKYSYKMQIRSIEEISRREEFETEEDLFKSWPHYNPMNMFDWSLEKGYFSVGFLGNNLDFSWVKRGEKYYFNSESFDRMSASVRSGKLGYTDLVLTSEAIKYKAWKVLSYKGNQHFGQFLKDFPEVMEVYKKIVWDSQTSEFAKKRKMKVNDFLRMRMGVFDFL